MNAPPHSQPDTNPSQNAVTGSSGTHPVPEGAADNAPPAILKARGDLAVENRNYWQAEAERRAARIAELEAELQRRSGVQNEDARPRVVDNDSGEISVTQGGKEIRGWSYASDIERRAKMLAAREYVEGWCDGREA